MRSGAASARGSFRRLALDEVNLRLIALAGSDGRAARLDKLARRIAHADGVTIAGRSDVLAIDSEK